MSAVIFFKIFKKVILFAFLKRLIICKDFERDLRI